MALEHMPVDRLMSDVEPGAVRQAGELCCGSLPGELAAFSVVVRQVPDGAFDLPDGRPGPSDV